MRQQVLDYIADLDLGGYFLSRELPWNESGLALYLKNLKRIYVDVEQFSIDNLISTLGSLTIQNEVITVRVYFASDAKTLSPNYQDLVQQLRRVNDIEVLPGINRREFDLSTTMENDLLVNEIEYRFYKILI
jgi:hypothetical protein